MALTPRDTLPEPPKTLIGLSDQDRKIPGSAVYALTDVKAHIAAMQGNGLNVATQTATDSILFELRWQLDDICGFISCLEKHHYRYSEWCYGSAGARIAFPADVYIMGYNRIKRKEWPELDPWNYFKFSFSLATNTVEIFSLHPEKERDARR
jgi:hypothetical protein